MQRDVRETDLYHEVREWFQRIHEPGFGRVTAAGEPDVSPDGTLVAFTGTKRTSLDTPPVSRVCTVGVNDHEMREITGGPNSDRYPRWSPDGTRLAFLSDRAKVGRFAPYVLEIGRVGEAQPIQGIDGTGEYLAWTADGARLLVGVAGEGAEQAGVQGSGVTPEDDKPATWLPDVDSGPDPEKWRRLYVIDGNQAHALPLDRLNVWEACWCGPDSILAVVSDGPEESDWYHARLSRLDAESGSEHVLYRSRWQIALPAASPSGRCACVEAASSDRAVVAGDVLIFGADEEFPQRIATAGVDVTWLTWRDEDRLLFGGVRELNSVFGEYRVSTGETLELWSTECSCGPYYPLAAPTEGDGFVIVAGKYSLYPEVVLVQNGEAQTLTALRHAGADQVEERGGRLEAVEWQAPDGLRMQGHLVLPEGHKPFALIVSVHGGPTATIRETWMGSTLTSLLVSRGYAVFLPNPRGSTGRGQEFARMVIGDMGGADMHDILSGIDALVERGIADPQRLGVMGVSYGGFMSDWIVTQTDRFAAAMPMSPVSDWFSQHYASNIGEWARLYQCDEATNVDGRYTNRSPLLHAGQVRTPVLQTAGARDRCTPPVQAIEFHQALLEHGVESVLVVYPEEGHGVRQMPAVIDLATRMVEWFGRHMPAKQAAADTATAS